jgi:CRISPR-associated protein Csb2
VNVFALEVEYLLGRVFAGDFQNRSESEWPPHPGRLFSALAAAYFENGANANEREALEWLECQRPPHIRAGLRGESQTPTAFVPTNYPGDGPPALRDKQPRFFPAQGPSETTVHFIWAEAEPAAKVASTLDQLASRTAYLGKACSVIRMRVADSAPEANYAPDGGGKYVLRVPVRGRLQELAWLFEADQRVSAGAQQRYRRTDESEGRANGPVGTEFGQMAVFRKKAGPGLPIEATLTLTEAVRKSLMSNAGNAGLITELLHGHNGDTHCAIAGLPFAGREHADGHLMGFALILPQTASLRDRRGVLAACRELEIRGLHIHGVGDWELEAADATTMNQTLRPMTWTRPSKIWRTVTPILLDRFPKKRGSNVEQILTAGCLRIGLPEPLAIEHGPYSSLQGVPPVPAFRLRRKDGEQPRWGVHAQIEFSVPVRGPIVLGAGRYFGLGLMRPDREENRNGQL